jgi:hypothetical protein
MSQVSVVTCLYSILIWFCVKGIIFKSNSVIFQSMISTLYSL